MWWEGQGPFVDSYRMGAEWEILTAYCAAREWMKVQG